MIEQLKAKIAALARILGIVQNNLQTVQGQKIYEVAVSCLGTDASPNDAAPDEYGCADSVSNILIKAGADMHVIVSTMELYKLLVGSERWVKVYSPLPGDVVISPTGMGGKNGIANGHTGIVGKNGVIMSNNSYTGKFEANYTLDTWKQRYVIKGGYPMFFLRKIQ